MQTPDPTSPPSPAPRSPLWMRIALGVSVSLNLLVVGAVVGGALARKPERAANAAPLPGQALIRALPREDRADLRRRFEAKAPRGPQDARVGVGAELLTLLRAEEFDGAAFATLLATQAAPVSARLTAGRDALIEQIAEMPRADRLAYADRLETIMSRPPGRKGGPEKQR